MTRQQLVDYTSIAMEKLLSNQGTLDSIMLGFISLTKDEKAMISFLLGATIGRSRYANLRIDRQVFKPIVVDAIDALAKDGCTFRFDE